MNPLLLYKLIGAAVLSLVLLGTGAYGGYRWEHGEVLKLKAADVAFDAKMNQLVQAHKSQVAAISAQSSVKQAAAQTNVITRVKTIIERIPYHVTNNAHCITYGLLRVLNSAASAPSSWQDGHADAECAPVTWQQFAGDIADDYGRSNQNSTELSGLQDWVRLQEKATDNSQGLSVPETVAPAQP